MRAGSLLMPVAVGMSVAIAVLASGPLAQAEPIEIQFTGLNLVYDSPQLFDAKSDAGRNNLPAESDKLNTVTFEANDTVVRIDNADVFADILIKGVLNIPAGGGEVFSSNGDTFGVDLFRTTVGDQWNLNLNLDQLSIWYSGFEIAIAASGTASSVDSQNLPAGVPTIDESKPINLAMVGTLSNVQTSGGFVTAFRASGTGSIAAVPEPSSLVGLLIGAVGLLAYAWRRRRG